MGEPWLCGGRQGWKVLWGALPVSPPSLGTFCPPGAPVTQRGTVAESTARAHLFRTARKNAWGAVEGRRIGRQEGLKGPRSGSTFYIVSLESRPATCQL